jgi:octaprenyl-diphosphate synthase
MEMKLAPTVSTLAWHSRLSMICWISPLRKRWGKPVGSDLREGKLTLPLIYLLDRCSEEESEKVKRVLDEGGFHSVSFPEILNLMDRHGALKRSRDKARDLAEQARAALSTFTDSPYKDALRSLPEFILEREF